MILYHFTAMEYLDSIKAVGLTKGEVPLTATECLNTVWFTTDSKPADTDESAPELRRGDITSAEDALAEVIARHQETLCELHRLHRRLGHLSTQPSAREL